MPPGDRSIAKAARSYYGDRFTIYRQRVWERWSVKHGWVRRVEAWDEERDRQARDAELAALREMKEKHTKAAQGLYQIGLASMARFQKEMQEDAKLRLAPTVFLQFMAQAAELERKARGEPDQIIKEIGGASEVIITWGHDVDDDEDEDPGSLAGDAPGPEEGP